jgi:hypothetical protein
MKINGCTIEVSTHAVDKNDSPRNWDCLGTIVNANSGYVFGEKQVVEHELDEIVDDYCLICVPIYLNNSAITTKYTGQPFNALIYCSNDTIKKEYPNVSMKDAIPLAVEAMEKEVAIYNQFLQGEVYQYTVTFPNGKTESVYGFYSAEEAFSEAEVIAEMMPVQPCSLPVQTNVGVGTVRI